MTGTGVGGFLSAMMRTRSGWMAAGTLAAMILWGGLTLLGVPGPWRDAPLVVACLAVGVPLLARVARDAWHRSFGADLLGLLALAVGAVMGEWFVAGWLHGGAD